MATSGLAPSAPLAGLGEAELLDRAPDGFGLGLDKRDLRFVIHYGAPASLEQYAREVGLIGRDGEPAHASLLYAPEDRSKHEALLAELRLVPAHVFGIVRAIEPYAVERRPATLEAVALAAGLSRRAAELAAKALEDAGAITHTDGWIRPAVDLPALFDRARRLAAWLETLRKQDAHRLAMLGEYAREHGCRSEKLARLLGSPLGDGRCACSVCQPSLHPAVSSGAPPPVRREPAREFSITTFERRSLREQPRGLTAKLGDFGMLARSGR